MARGGAEAVMLVMKIRALALALGENPFRSFRRRRRGSRSSSYTECSDGVTRAKAPRRLALMNSRCANDSIQSSSTSAIPPARGSASERSSEAWGAGAPHGGMPFIWRPPHPHLEQQGGGFFRPPKGPPMWGLGDTGGFV